MSNPKRRSWSATGANNYWYVRENDPEGTGSIGEPIVLSQGNKKAAFQIAELLTEVYQAGLDDGAIQPTPLKAPRYPALDESLRGLTSGEYLVRLENGTLHLAEPTPPILAINTRVVVSSAKNPPWRGTIIANKMVAPVHGRLQGWYLVASDAGRGAYEVLPANLIPEEERESHRHEL